MSYIKRQELFKEVNPYLKKFHQDGNIPPSYIPANKRHKIATYMGRTSVNFRDKNKSFDATPMSSK